MGGGVFKEIVHIITLWIEYGQDFPSADDEQFAAAAFAENLEDKIIYQPNPAEDYWQEY